MMPKTGYRAPLGEAKHWPKLTINEDAEMIPMYKFDHRTDSLGLIEVAQPKLRGDYIYPSTFFDKQPVIRMSKNDSKVSMDLVLGNLKIMLADDVMNIQLIKLYLIHYFRVRCQVATDVPWESFGHVIVPDNLKSPQNISPNSLLAFVDTDLSCPLTNKPINHTPDILDSYAAFCFSFSRICDTNYPEYKNRILENLTGLIGRNVPEKDIGQILNYFNNNKPLSMDTEYRRLIAAFDMFIFHFQSAGLPYAKIRQMTVHSHYKDCNALALYDHTMVQTALGSLLPFWMWLPALAKEHERIFYGGQEMQMTDSYRPWASFYGAMGNSPYSTTANPNLTFFCHAICLVLGSSWSANAVMPSCNPIPLIKNAALIIYAMGQSSDLQQMYSRNPEIFSANRVTRVVDTEIPRTMDPDEWGSYMRKTYNGRIPDFIVDEYLENVRALNLPMDRENTILRQITQYMRAHIKNANRVDQWVRPLSGPKSSSSSELCDDDDISEH